MRHSVDGRKVDVVARSGLLGSVMRFCEGLVALALVEKALQVRIFQCSDDGQRCRVIAEEAWRIQLQMSGAKTCF